MNASPLIAASLLAAGAGAGFAGVITSARSPETVRVVAVATETIEGVIESVKLDQRKPEFTLLVEEEDSTAMKPKKVTCNISETTVYTLDGKPSDMRSALRVGYWSTVTHDEGLALKVESRTEPTSE